MEKLFLMIEILPITLQKMRPLRKDMQIIFQDPYSSLNPKIYIGEAIMEPMRVMVFMTMTSKGNNVVIVK